MAGRNKQGPQGMGPMTGRGMGTCGGQHRQEMAFDEPRGRGGRGNGGRGRGGRGQGAGFGQGRGQGRGRGFGGGNGRRQAGPEWSPEATPPHALALLTKEVADLKAQLADLVAKISGHE